MENITWRMMALALKKKKEQEDPPAPTRPDVRVKTEISLSTPALSQLDSSSSHPPFEERGRPFAKGKAKVQVIGFDGTNQDSTEDDEYVVVFNIRLGPPDLILLQC